MGDERLGEAASRHWLEHRCLDLDKTPLGERVPDRSDHPRAEEEPFPDALVRPQVDLALAEADIRVRDPSPFVSEPVACLGEEHP